MKRFIVGIGLLFGMGIIAHADTQGNAALLGTSTTGPYTGNSTFTLVDQYNVTSSLILKNLTMSGNLLGNLPITGNETVTGNQAVTGNSTIGGTSVFTPVSQINVSTQVSINPTTTFMVIASTGGAVTFGIGSAYPAISTASAVSGQYLILVATQSVNTVAIATSSLTGVVGPDSTITLTSASKGAIAFIFDGLRSLWVEVSKQ